MPGRRLRLFESMMQNTLFCWGINLALILIVFFNAELGQLLGLKEQSLAISVVWPATGFSLAAMLLFGYKTWPGIFLGNLAYNALNLYFNADAHTFSGPLLTATTISLGSLGQAFLSTYIMRHYTSEGYFNTVKDIFIFLIPASLLTCLLASSIGVMALHIYGTLPLETMFYVWAIFWLGDTMGIYIFTPLLVVWLLTKPLFNYSRYKWEILLIIISFLTLSLLTFYEDYPFEHLFLPLSLWATYRFRMHGATMSIFLISLTAITLTSLGFGLYGHNIYPNSLGVLVSFLEIIVVASLILAAVINEREEAWHLIQNQNQDLKETIAMREETLKEMQSALFIKKKLIDSLSQLTAGITKQLREPLKHISDFVKASNVCLSHLQQIAIPKKAGVDRELNLLLNENLKTLEGYLLNIAKFEVYSDRVVKAILEQSILVAPTTIEVKLVNLNTLINSCLQHSTAKERQQNPSFNFIKNIEFSTSINEVLALPDSLTYAFTRLIDHAIRSLKIKKEKLRASFVPKLEIRTINHPDNIEIVINENAAALPLYRHIFGSFFEEGTEADVPKLTPTFIVEDPEARFYLDLALAHDILVHVHNGSIDVNFKEDEYMEIVILFPKHYLKTQATVTSLHK